MKIKQKEDRKIRLKKGDKTEEQDSKSEEQNTSKKRTERKRLKGLQKCFQSTRPLYKETL